MANVYDITIEQGSSFGINLTATDSNGSPLNLSGYAASGQIRFGYGSSGVLAFLNTTIDPSYVSGIIHVSLTPSGSSNLPVTVAVYDVSVLSADGSSSFKAIKGYANVLPGVSSRQVYQTVQFQPDVTIQSQIDILSGMIYQLQQRAILGV